MRIFLIHKNKNCPAVGSAMTVSPLHSVLSTITHSWSSVF